MKLTSESHRKMFQPVRLWLSLSCLCLAVVAGFFILLGRNASDVDAGREASPPVLEDPGNEAAVTTAETAAADAVTSDGADISSVGSADDSAGANEPGEDAEDDTGEAASAETDRGPRSIQLAAQPAGATHSSFAIAARDPDAARTQMRSFVKEIVRTPVVMEDGETYEQIALPGNTLAPEESGVPNVPHYEELIHVPNGVEVAMVVDNVRYREFEQVTPVAPAQPPKPGGCDLDGNELETPFVKQADAYSHAGYPEQAVVRIGEDVTIRGQRFVKVVYNPLQYDPVAAKLRVAVEAEWALTFDGTPVAAREDPKWRGRKRVFQLDADPWVTATEPEPEATPSSSTPVRMSPERITQAEALSETEPLTEADIFSFASPTYNVDEGAGSVTLTINCNKSSTATVNYAFANGTATGGSDYDNTNGSVTFNSTSSESFTVNITDDFVQESDETFTVTIDGGASTVVTILDNDTAGTVELPSSSLNHNENGGSITVLVSRVSGSSGAVSVDYATANGTAVAGSDYVATNGTLNWTNGDSAAKPLVVEVIDDAVADSSTNETFTISLSNPGGGVALGLSSMTVNLADDEIPGNLQFSSSSYSVAEAGFSKQITVNRVGGSSGAVGVSYATANGSATAGSDYTTNIGTLSWNDGETAAKTFTVNITDDSDYEGNETVTLSLSSPTGGAGLGSPVAATLTITDDDESSIGAAADADYLILTADAYYDAVLPLAKWKHSKGFKVHITRFSELPGTSATDVKNFFIEAYTNGTMTSYGLIVGDHADVPGYAITWHPECSGANMPFHSDHPYACVDGSDFYADMVVTRLSGDTVEQVTTLVNKVLTYEKNPDMGSWYRNVLVAGQFQDYWRDLNGDGTNEPPDLVADRWFMEDLHRIADFLGPDYDFFGTWNGLSEIDKGYNIYTALKWDSSTTSNLLYKTDGYALRITPPNPVPASWKAMGSGTKTEISAAVNNGVSMVFHRDHGYASYTGDGSDGLGWGAPDYQKTDVDSLTNGNKLPVVFTLNCGTGHWDAYPTGLPAIEDGFAEHWVRNPNGGAVFVTGAARLSYTGPNDTFVAAIMDSFYDDYSTYSNGVVGCSWRVGEALLRAKGALMANWGSGDTSYGTLTARMFNMFGDPEMMVRTDTPTNIVVTGVPASAALGSLNNVTITATVGGSALANARFCISKWGSDDYWVGFTDGSGQATLGMTPSSTGKYDVVVCGDAHDTAEIHNNSIPYTNQIQITSSIAAPTDVSATVIATNQIDLAWTDNSTNETGFAIQRSLTGGKDYVHIGGTAANATSYSDTGVAPGNIYYYKVTATNADEFSVSGMTSVFIVDTPIVVNSTNTTALTETSCRVYGELQDGLFADAWICWGESDGDAATSAWDHVVYVGSVSQGVPFSIDVTGLSTNTTYFYRSYVTNNAGVAWSVVTASFSGTPVSVTGDGMPSVSGVIVATDFTDRTVSGATAQNLTWTVNGVDAPGDLTAIDVNSTGLLAGLFDTTEAQNYFAPDLNVANEGPWSVDVPLVIASGYESVTVSNVVIDWRDFANTGVVQANNISKLYTVTIRDSSEAVLGSNMVATVAAKSGVTNITFNPAIVLSRVDTYTFNLRVDKNSTVGNNPGVNALTVEGSYSAIRDPIVNKAPTAITETGAHLNGLLDASGTNYAVYVYYGTTDGGSNVGSWDASAYVGSWSDVSTNVSCSVGLAAGTINYYTFMASNDTTNVWAAPSWRFTTLGTPKETPTISVWPTTTPITYGQTYADAGLSNGTASVTGTFSYNAPATVPNAGTNAAAVTFTPDDTANYNTVASSVDVVVSKATPTVDPWPTATSIETGQALSDSTLSGGNASVAGTFGFQTPSETPPLGTNSVNVIFTPAIAANYNTVTGAVDVVVTAALIPATATLSNLAQTYDGTARPVTVTTDPVNLAVTVTYAGSSVAPTNVGSYTVVATITEPGYKGSTNGTLVVSKGTPTVDTWPSASAITVGQAVSNSVLSDGSSTPSGGFSFDDPSATPSEGTYGAAVTFTPDDSENWTPASGTVYITVLPLPPSVPTGLSAVPSIGQVDLSWSPVSGAISYKVKRASVPGGPYGTVGTSAITSYTDSVANGATYYYVVSAVNAGGEGADSDEVSATLLHVLPFSEDFEALNIGDLKGQNGWYATNAVVQTNVAIDIRAVSISTKSGLMSQEFANSESNVWTDFELQPVFCPDDMTPSSTNATAFVYFNTNGNPVVYDGPALTTITDVSIVTGTWVRVTIESDYAAKTWDLYIDSSPVATDLGFYSTSLTHYHKFTVSGAGDTSATLDDLVIGPVSPFGELLSLAVFSPHGTPNPAGTNWYTNGATVNFEMNDSPFIIATNSKYEAIGWIGAGSLTSGTGTSDSFTITNDTTLTWQWTTNYWVELDTAGE